jgi:ubiquitin-conjugating enzyme E2 Z
MEFVSKETIKRLIKDVKDIMHNPLVDNGIYYSHDDTDMLKGYALIIGPEDTPYFGGNYFFEFKYPTEYPHKPPKVTYCTNGDEIRFNPNLYKCGKVCVSILNTWSGDQWTSCQTISTVLLTLCSLLCKNPLLNEPGVNKQHPELEKYSRIIEHSNIKIAVYNTITKKEGYYKNFFDLFYPYVKNNFLKNYEKLVHFVRTKQEEMKNATVLDSNACVISIKFYGMSVKMDYENLLELLNKSKELLEKEGLKEEKEDKKN